MKYLKLTDDKWVEVDEERDIAKIVSKKEAAKQLADAQERLAQLPQEPDEKELLEWAKENHPQAMDYSVEKSNLESIISDSKKLLEMGE